VLVDLIVIGFFAASFYARLKTKSGTITDALTVLRMILQDKTYLLEPCFMSAKTLVNRK
jgi:hypothetical protein